MNWIPKFAVFALAGSLLYSADGCCPPGAFVAPGCSCRQYEEIYGRLYPATPCLADPCKPCGRVWTLDASFLAWQAREEGLSFALNSTPTTTFASIDVNGKFVGIDFDWEPAVKVRLGVDFPGSSWDMNTRWTFFYTHSTTTAKATPSSSNTGLMPLWSLPNANGAISLTLPTPVPLYGRAHGSWQLRLNEFDYELGYHAMLTPSLSLRFDGGLKAAIVDQKFRATYTEGVDNGTTQLLSAQTVLKNDAWGIGPRVGFDSKWRFTKDWSFVTSLSGSLPLWEFKIKRTDFDSSVGMNGLDNIHSSFKSKVWVFSPIVEALLGISWDTCLGCRDQFAVGFQADYEFQYFWQQNKMAMLVNDPLFYLPYLPNGDLHFHGVTLTFHFGY